MESCSQIIKDRFPNIDDDIQEYLESVLESTCEDMESIEDVYDGIGEILLDIDKSKTEVEVREICNQLANIMKPDWERETRNDQTTMQVDPQTKQENFFQSPELPLIRKPIEPNRNETETRSKENNKKEELKKFSKKKGKKKKSQVNGQRYGVNEISVNQRPGIRIKAVERAKEYVNNKDIHIENFDISYGKKELILDADFLLEYGQRYGFVGRNGLGKTVMLRCLADGNLKLTTHMSCVHVEQEVEADSRSALQAVLESDAMRQELLEREKHLTTLMEAGQEGVSADLTEVFTPEWSQ